MDGTKDREDEGDAAPAVKVVDRRWWARGDAPVETESPSLKPRYVEELEARLAEKDRLLQSYIEQYKTASTEFDEARIRARREVTREVERGKRAIVVELLEVVDNLDLAIQNGRTAQSVESLLQGIEMVRAQFLARLDALGITEVPTVGETFDPARHEAVTVVPAARPEDDDRVVGLVRRGFAMRDEVLRPAMVAVGKVQPEGAA